MWTPFRLAAAFVLGALGGIACDQIHVRLGTLWYPHPRLLGQDWWVGPLFGTATVVMLAACAPFARAAAARTPAWRFNPILAGAAWFLGAYVASGLWGISYPVPLAAAYGALFVARLVIRGDRTHVLVFGLLIAAGGCATEALLAWRGLFWYTAPGPWLVPVWLPGLYLHGAPLAIDIAQALQRRTRPAQPAAASASTTA